MVICDICTGRHHTSACVIARDRVEQCFTGTPDDYRPSVAPVVSLAVERQRRSGRSAEENSALRAERHRQRWGSKRTATGRAM